MSLGSLGWSSKKSQQPSAPSPHSYFHNKQHHALGYTAARQEEIHKTELTNQAWAKNKSVSPCCLVDPAFTFKACLLKQYVHSLFS